MAHHVHRLGGDDLPVVADTLDRDALDEAAADRRVVALDAGVDDRDTQAAAARVPERPGAVDAAPRALVVERLAVALGERLAPGGQVEAHRRNERGAGRADRRASASRISSTRPSWSGDACRARATASASAHRRPPPSSSRCRATSPTASLDRRGIRVGVRGEAGQRLAQELGRVPLDPAGLDRDGRLAREHRREVEVAQRVRPLGLPVEDLEHADAAAVVEDRDREDRPWDVAGGLRPRAVEPRVRRHVGHRERLPGREHVARDPCARGEGEPDGARTLAARGDPDDELVRVRLVERDGRGLGAEHEHGGLGDGAQQRLAALRLEARGDGGAGGNRLERGDDGRPVVGIGHRRVGWFVSGSMDAVIQSSIDPPSGSNWLAQIRPPPAATAQTRSGSSILATTRFRRGSIRLTDRR